MTILITDCARYDNQVGYMAKSFKFSKEKNIVIGSLAYLPVPEQKKPHNLCMDFKQKTFDCCESSLSENRKTEELRPFKFMRVA